MKSANAKRPAPRTAFKRGQSGNPHGRPKLPEDVKEILRTLHRPAVLKLGSLLGSADERVALRAAEVIIERNQGKVPMVLDEAEVAPPAEWDLSRLTDEELSVYRAICVKATERKDASASEPESVN